VRVEIASQAYFLIPADISLIEERIFDAMRAAVASDRDYHEPIASRFDRLLFLLIKFVRSRTDDVGALRPYLARFSKRASAPPERELQLDLFDYLLGHGYVEMEKSSVSAGRADLYLPELNFRFVIEVKRLLDDWEQELVPFIGQTAAYQQTDIRLGVLAVLDLTLRSAGTPHFEQCFDARVRTFDDGDKRRVIVVRVPGNRTVPSQQP
jgi:hypothetical protein